MSYPESKSSISASVHIHSVQTKVKHYKSMVKAALMAKSYTSWAIHSTAIFYFQDITLSSDKDKNKIFYLLVKMNPYKTNKIQYIHWLELALKY